LREPVIEAERIGQSNMISVLYNGKHYENLKEEDFNTKYVETDASKQLRRLRGEDV